jgi:NADPH-dependent 2,4-dienoyl-CoA reductase/sulfur reductase-like enzyme
LIKSFSSIFTIGGTLPKKKSKIFFSQDMTIYTPIDSPSRVDKKCVIDDNLYDVIVVGGGVSGLSAMSTLAKAGRVNTLLHEGANRLGGRILTVPFGGNSHLEMGAQVLI